MCGEGGGEGVVPDDDIIDMGRVFDVDLRELINFWRNVYFV